MYRAIEGEGPAVSGCAGCQCRSWRKGCDNRHAAKSNVQTVNNGELRGRVLWSTRDEMFEWEEKRRSQVREK